MRDDPPPGRLRRNSGGPAWPLAASLALAAVSMTPDRSAAQVPAQTSADEYTRYELLAPGSGAFRIFYDVTATTPGARWYFNAIRRGSASSDEAVTDPVTGLALPFEIVDGAVARTQGLPRADTLDRYIRVVLPRAVSEGGEIRLHIAKTYRDTASYVATGDEIVFTRSLGIRRNAVVLPAGFELTGCNVPAQVFREADGRIVASFMLSGPGAPVVVVRGRRLPS